MLKLTRILFSIALLLFTVNNVFSKELEISNTTLNSVKKIFGHKNIISSPKIHIKVNNGKKMLNGEYLVIEEQIKIKFVYIGKAKDIELMGVFIDGNRIPLVASLSIGGSSLTKNPYFVVSGKADKYCEGNYKAVIVIKINNQLLSNKIPFRTTIADCGGSNG